MLKISAVTWALNDDGQVLCVSRKGDTTKWTLPGGKVESQDVRPVLLNGSSNLLFQKAAAREFEEETGIWIPWWSLEAVFAAAHDDEWWCVLHKVKQRLDKGLAFSGEEGSKVAWMRFEDLVASCPFSGWLLQAKELGAI